MERHVEPLASLDQWFPGQTEWLSELNRALRNINFGKMDHLPYYEPLDDYRLAMRADLIPQGAAKPPAIGHWQIEVTRQGLPFRLLLQGKSRGNDELGELVDNRPASE
jgi:hypothetical protein